jgi:hypothetical protein
MYKFELDKDQIKKYEKWHKGQINKNPHLPTAGERFTFMFTPTGLGTMAFAKDVELNEKIDLTDWDNF